MDQQKTGQLIAQRRKEQNMTQKMLADQLGISDRAISKWERGLGFPDVSLIEPLADALELSLAELFAGERHIPADDASAREVLRFTLPKIRKYRRRILLLLALVILLSVALLALPWQSGFQTYTPISAAEAVSVTPEILISKADSDLIDAILADPELGAYYEPYPLWKEITAFTLENEDAEGFTDYFHNLEMDLQYAEIGIDGDFIFVIYSTANTSVYLYYRGDDITKTVVTYDIPIWDEAGQLIPVDKRSGDRIDLENKNNQVFRRGGYTASWLDKLLDRTWDSSLNSKKG